MKNLPDSFYDNLHKLIKVPGEENKYKFYKNNKNLGYKKFLFIDKFECWKEVFEDDSDWKYAKTFEQILYEAWKYNSLIAEIEKGEK